MLKMSQATTTNVARASSIPKCEAGRWRPGTAPLLRGIRHTVFSRKFKMCVHDDSGCACAVLSQVGQEICDGVRLNAAGPIGPHRQDPGFMADL